MLCLLLPVSFWIPFWPQSRKRRSGSFPLSSLRMENRGTTSGGTFTTLWWVVGWMCVCISITQCHDHPDCDSWRKPRTACVSQEKAKVCWLEFFLFISDPAFLLAKPLGLMNSISSSFPEVPLAKPCASYTGVMWWFYIARSKESWFKGT